MDTYFANFVANLRLMTRGYGRHKAIADAAGVSEATLYAYKNGSIRAAKHGTVIQIAEGISTVLGLKLTAEDLYRSPKSPRNARAIQKVSKAVKAKKRAARAKKRRLAAT